MNPCASRSSANQSCSSNNNTDCPINSAQNADDGRRQVARKRNNERAELTPTILARLLLCRCPSIALIHRTQQVVCFVRPGMQLAFCCCLLPLLPLLPLLALRPLLPSGVVSPSVLPLLPLGVVSPSVASLLPSPPARVQEWPV